MSNQDQVFFYQISVLFALIVTFLAGWGIKFLYAHIPVWWKDSIKNIKSKFLLREHLSHWGPGGDRIPLHHLDILDPSLSLDEKFLSSLTDKDGKRYRDNLQWLRQRSEQLWDDSLTKNRQVLQGRKKELLLRNKTGWESYS